VREVHEQIGEMVPRIVVLDTLNESLPGSESKDVDMAAKASRMTSAARQGTWSELSAP
jgi:hypothetical protein